MGKIKKTKNSKVQVKEECKIVRQENILQKAKKSWDERIVGVVRSHVTKVDKSFFETGFVLGYREAERFISVEEGFPEDQRDVLILSDKGNYGIGYFHGPKSETFIPYSYSPSDDFSVITHWRYINNTVVLEEDDNTEED